MGRPTKCSDETFLSHVAEFGVAKTAELLGYSDAAAVRTRIRTLNKRAFGGKVPNSARVDLEVKDGCVVVGSDAHYWPGLGPSTAHSAMVRLVRDLAPVAVNLNGDVIDAPSVSKFTPIGWETRPSLWDEVLAAQERTAEIEEAAGPYDIHLSWTLGNHDARFETYIANVAPQYRGVTGIHLKDHFPNWTPAWSVRINWTTDPVVIKHRIGGSDRALITNIQKAGTHIVTGHTHAANVWSFSNYRQTLYGVDTGTLAVPYGPQFTNYTEDNPVNWRSSVTVLTFVKGRLLPPEQLIVIDEEKRLTAFRGQVHQEAK